MSARAARIVSTALLVLAVVLDVTAHAIAVSDGKKLTTTQVFALGLLFAFSIGGWVIARRQRGNAIGWLFLVVGISVGLSGLTSDYADRWVDTGEGARLAGEIAVVYSDLGWIPSVLIPATYLLLLFPDGHLLTSRWRPVAWCSGLGILGLSATTCLLPGKLQDHPGTTNPFGVDSPVIDPLQGLSLLLVAIGVLGSAGSLVVRFRRARGEQRQQMKWIALAGAVAAVTFPVMLVLYDVVGSDVANSTILLSILGLPVATAVAVARYRLYDIDVVINRALVYGSLTATLAGMYVGSVLLLQLALNGLTQGSGLAVATSTLAVAALFRPVRSRIQDVVDRRFFRSKYDAVRTLQAFAVRLRDEVDLDELSADLRTVVTETMRPTHVTLWLRTKEQG